MRTFILLVALFGFINVAVSIARADEPQPVPLPCEPNCTIDPCKLAPERCKPSGPIGHSPAKVQKVSDKARSDTSEDSCKWCQPCSKTPGAECLKCCTPGGNK